MKAVSWLLLPTLALLTAAVPGLGEYERALAESETHLDDARMIGRATAAIQNALGRRLEAQGLSCTDADVRDLLARVRHLGHAYRDAAQAFRVRAERVDRLGRLPTVAPLLSGELGERAAAVVRGAKEEVQRYRTTAGVQRELVERSLAGCPATLAVGPGLSPPQSATVPVVVIGVGTGLVCPANVPAAGAVVVLEHARACWAPEICDCTPEPVGHGAVLGEDS